MTAITNPKWLFRLSWCPNPPNGLEHEKVSLSREKEIQEKRPLTYSLTHSLSLSDQKRVSKFQVCNREERCDAPPSTFFVFKIFFSANTFFKMSRTLLAKMQKCKKCGRTGIVASEWLYSNGQQSDADNYEVHL